MDTITRREFCLGLAAAAGAGALRGLAPRRGGGRYSVAILGDTHYDAEPESIYHSHYDESNRWAKVQHAEFRRNGEMWRERCPRMIAASADLAARIDTRFVLQLGDLIQGDCDDAATHKKMLDDCIRLLRAPYPAAIPFLTVIGNHDFRGKGARPAYMEFAERFMSAEIGALAGLAAAPAKYPVYSFDVGPDAWIFCDFETRDLQPVIDAVEGAARARHVFLVTHGPFTTPDSGSHGWRLGGRKECDALRPRLYAALSRRRAVVLSGHTHTTAYYRHENKFGGFCEFTVNSVWARPELATGEPIHSSVEDYGAINLSRQTGGKLEDLKAALDFFRPGLKEYFYSDAAGHYRLGVADGAVEVAFYPGDARSPAWRKTLKKAAV